MSITVEVRQFVNEGKLITAMIPVDPATLDRKVLTDIKDVQFSGTYTIPTPHGAMRKEFEFPNGWTLDQCFANFEEEAKKDFIQLQEEAQKEAAAQKLWTPDGKGKGGGILVPK